MTHTPGPWKVEREKYDLVIIGSNEDYIAYVIFDEHLLPEEQDNANLIAAAPNMLNALIAVDEWFEGDRLNEPKTWLELGAMVKQAMPKIGTSDDRSTIR